MKKHVLIIDDDELTRRMFGTKLSAEGFEVLYAASGDRGHEMARRHLPDLILLDIRLGEPDGFAVASRIHSDKLTKDIPIIFLSNTEVKPESENAMRETWGAQYIHKGTDLKEIVKLIKKTIPK